MARIAFIGGTGPEGLGLAMRFVKSGNAVFIGSRTEERAAEAVAQVQAALPEGEVYGGFNIEGAEKAEFVFVTVPADAHHDILVELAEAIGDKIVVDCVVPMVIDKDGPRPAPPQAGSAAEEARDLLPKAKVVSGFHHVDGKQLQKLDRPMQGDVLVCGDHKTAKKKVMGLVEEIQYMRALDGGSLVNSRITEAMTALLITINKQYKAHSGISITGV
ncbi:MAG TPA: NADPH-dependent F420 reductase [Dehalococcoidia bacterium]